MVESARRRKILVVLALLGIVILLLLGRCVLLKPAAPADESGAASPASSNLARNQPATVVPGARYPDERLDPATVTAPARVVAGAVFSAAWTGPDNRGDYVIVTPSEAPAAANGNHKETQHGKPLELTAPIEPGKYEVRYVTGRSRTILGRTPIEVVPAEATLDAAAEVALGAPFSVAWTGPNNKDDYVTIVPKDARDEQYESYANTEKGSPATLTAPTAAGEFELRYVSGQGKKVLARRTIKVAAAVATMAAPADAVAGTTVEVAWTGPNNAGDYVTLVPVETPDGQYGNYANTSHGSPLKLLVPIMAGNAEFRYMTGQGRRVLGRLPIKVVAAAVTLSAPPECAAGADVSVAWTGPNNPGDYITIVSKETPDGRYAAYRNTATGSPLTVKAPKEAGNAEVRYMTGQGNKVLARAPIKVVP